MPIKTPGKHSAKATSLKTVKGAHGRKSVNAELNVTPMVDMLTVFVVFLLMTFSASGEILFISKEISLPTAYHSGSLERSPVISVSPISVSFQGEGVMDTPSVNARWYPDWKLGPLYDKLEWAKKKWREGHPDRTFGGEVIIQSDGDVQFEVIKLVMFTCAQAGYLNVSFAVQKGAATVVGAEG
jgi:biopolymer transport protein ExbD